MSYLDTTGRIFDIQRFSVHDGRGIRTIVFFKGCAFRCPWCCNPESQRFETETMLTSGVKKQVGSDITVRDAIAEAERDVAYYRRSGGGLTLSGGECLMQPEFARDLLRAAYEIGLTTAIESMACVPRESVTAVLPYLDTYLMDIKHTDAQKHKAFIGKDNVLTLENARYVASCAESQRAAAQRDASHVTELVIRVPVVPTFNATEEEISAIARFAASLKVVKTVHLLPYHRLGSGKYGGLGRTYSMAHISPPNDGQMEVLKNAALNAVGGKIDVIIGG
jgi:pyruvate formate lyase activating enzyme